MNGPKVQWDMQGHHNHIHGATPHKPTVVTDKPLAEVMASDALLLQDRSHNRASFQGRFRKTAFGDFKGRPGRADEMSEASQEDYVFNQAKEEAALTYAAVTEAAAAVGVIVEESNG